MKGLPLKRPDEFCNGRNKAHSKYCGHLAGWGTQHQGVGRCKLHGGAEDHAEVNGMVQLARRDMAAMGVPLDLPPTRGILECIRIAAGEVRYASDRIALLAEVDLVGPVTSTVDRPLKEEKGAESSEHRVEEIHKGAPDVNVWVRVRHDAMDRLVRYEAAALKAGIEERQQSLNEGMAVLMANGVRNILRALGVENHPDAPRIVREQFQLMSGATLG